MKRVYKILPFLCIFYLFGCGTESVISDDNQLRVLNNGRVEELIIESFEKGYYDFDELKSFIEAEVNVFNRGENLVKVKRIEQRSNEVYLEYEFQNIEAYNQYMANDIQKLPLKALTEEDTDFIDLVVDVETGDAITLQQLKKYENFILLAIKGEDKLITVDGNIKFSSQNCELINAHTVRVLDDKSAIIVYELSNNSNKWIIWVLISIGGIILVLVSYLLIRRRKTT